jgi:hypothetical protein
LPVALAGSGSGKGKLYCAGSWVVDIGNDRAEYPVWERPYLTHKNLCSIIQVQGSSCRQD